MDRMELPRSRLVHIIQPNDIYLLRPVRGYVLQGYINIFDNFIVFVY